MKNDFGPGAEERIKKVWQSCRLTLQAEIDKVVDKIVESIADIYSKP